MFFKKNKNKPVKAVELTDNNFQDLVVDASLPVLLDFWAPWCGPCKIIGPIIDELAEEFQGRAIIGKINVDQNPGLSQHFRVKSIPTLFFIKGNQVVERFVGMVPKPNLEEILEELIAAKSDEEE